MSASKHKSFFTAVGCFGGFWTLMTLLFDGLIFYGIFCQLLTYSFRPVSATVLKSAVTTHSDSEGGNTYNVDIAYAYSANGEHTSTRYRYGQSASSDNWAKRVVGQNPVGSTVTVYYNPGKPSEAVMVRGIEGVDLFLLLFLTPFNMVLLAFWSFKISRRRGHFPGVSVIEEPTATRARIVTLSPLGMAGVVLGAGAFLAVFLLGFFSGWGFHPPLDSAIFTWLALLCIAFNAFALRRKRVRSGTYDLVIDRTARTLTLPPASKRRERLTVPLADIDNIVVEKTATSAEVNDQTVYRHAVVVKRHAGRERHSDAITDWYEEEHAEAFALWLRERLK